jgi:uncharacterized glyoxalase superfamily protein PhnB
MKFNSFFPVIWTENFEETIGFYLHILKFSLIDANSVMQWAFLEKDNVKVMISKPNKHEKFDKIGFSGSFYFNVNDVNDLWLDLKTITKICYKIETFDWGMREFAIYDNNGYILQFGQPLSEISKEE